MLLQFSVVCIVIFGCPSGAILIQSQIVIGTIMRVYLASGAKLLEATPQFVPVMWRILYQEEPARVDDLLTDGIEDVQAYGTFQVVPGGESVVTTFRYSLPASVIQSGAGQSTLPSACAETTGHTGGTDNYPCASSLKTPRSNRPRVGR